MKLRRVTMLYEYQIHPACESFAVNYDCPGSGGLGMSATWCDDPGKVLEKNVHGKSDPVFRTARGWFWWDETWRMCHGPHDTRDLAKDSVRQYALSL